MTAPSWNPPALVELTLFQLRFTTAMWYDIHFSRQIPLRDPLIRSTNGANSGANSGVKRIMGVNTRVKRVKRVTRVNGVNGVKGVTGVKLVQNTT